MITSDAIESTRNKVNSLLGEFSQYVEELPRLQAVQKEVDTRKENVVEYERRLAKQEEILKIRESDLQREREALDKDMQKLNQRAISVVTKEDNFTRERKEWLEKATNLDGRESNLVAKENALLKREEEVNKLDAQLKEREEEMRKQIAIDRDRKESLDIRQRKIDSDQQRVNHYLSQIE